MPLTCAGMSWDGPSPVLTSAISAPLGRLPRSRALLQVREEAPDPLPNLLASREAAPARADQADELVALVDRHQEVLARAERAIDQQRFDVRRHVEQHGVRVLQLRPGLEPEERLRRAHRARVEGHDSLLERPVEE